MILLSVVISLLSSSLFPNFLVSRMIWSNELIYFSLGASLFYIIYSSVSLTTSSFSLISYANFSGSSFLSPAILDPMSTFFIFWVY